MPDREALTRGSTPRVRCLACGSTRVRAITAGYLDGPLIVGEDGRVQVDESRGEWVAHDLGDLSAASVNCSNCGGGRFRVEGAPERVTYV